MSATLYHQPLLNVITTLSTHHWYSWISDTSIFANSVPCQHCDFVSGANCLYFTASVSNCNMTQPLSPMPQLPTRMFFTHLSIVVTIWKDTTYRARVETQFVEGLKLQLSQFSLSIFNLQTLMSNFSLQRKLRRKSKA